MPHNFEHVKALLLDELKAHERKCYKTYVRGISTYEEYSNEVKSKAHEIECLLDLLA